MLSNSLGSSKVIGILFSAPAMNGQPPSACEQVMMAANSPSGLNSSSYFFEKPITGCSFEAYLKAYTGLSPLIAVSTLNPEFAKFLATIGNKAVASVPPE